MIRLSPCIDSPARAEACRRRLDIPRGEALRLGRETIAILEQGWYKVPGRRKRVRIEKAVVRACGWKRSIAPDDGLPFHILRSHPETVVRVANETTLAAARPLVDRGLYPIALNFANGVEPGGGFLRGARAQEEALCRSSALYATLVDDAMYKAHRTRPRPDSTSWSIWSPDVPVLRDDDGNLLAEPWELTFLTCAAPYAPAIGQPEAGDLLEARIHRVLEICRSLRHRALVLGAWGCGAFGNDPDRTARDFRAALEGPFDGHFEEVVFAIADWSAERRYLLPFANALASV